MPCKSIEIDKERNIFEFGKETWVAVSKRNDKKDVVSSENIWALYK